MISNERQYRKSLKSLAGFKAQLEEARERYGHDPILFQLEATQLERYINELGQEVVDYEQAMRGELASVLPAFNPRSGRVEVARALVKMRLAKGMTQEELAQQLGTHQPSITRWESEEYEAYRLGDLKRLANALGRDLDVVFVARPETEPQAMQHRSLYDVLDEILASAPILKEALRSPEARAELKMELERAIRLLAEETAVTAARQKEAG